jgi:hypothetical protein
VQRHVGRAVLSAIACALTGWLTSTPTHASSPPADPPGFDQVSALFADLSRFHNVRASSTDQLIGAMIEASESARPTVIELAAGTYLFAQNFPSASGASLLPTVTSTLLISGRGARLTILDGQGGNGTVGRAFTVLPHGHLMLRDLTVRDFYASCGHDCQTNGGGAIENLGGDLRLEDIVVSGNIIASNEGAATLGGAILNQQGRLEAERTTVSGNAATGLGGGGLAVTGGSAVLMHSLLLDNSALQGCCAGSGGAAFGGGVYVNNARLALISSTIANNFAGPGPGSSDGNLGFGAGLYNDGNGEVWMANTAVVNNLAGASGSGGGIHNNGRMLIANSTIGGNQVGARGGGIFNSGDLSLQAVTLANNSEHGLPLCRLADSDCLPGGHDLWTGASATTRIATSIVGDCAGGTLQTEGHDAFGPGALCLLQPSRSVASGITQDLVNVQPGLAALRDDHQPGKAHYPLLAGSPLIDAGGRIGSFCTPKDQLGNLRSARNQSEVLCDIGAVEYEAPHRR